MEMNANYSEEMMFKEVETYITSKDDLALVHRAFDYAKEKHEGQFRKSGEPYFIHLVNVAYILATLRVGPSTIAAGLLHDVVEDCGISKSELAEAFNEEIATLVESVTKIGALKFKDEKEYLAENHRKIFIAMAKDVRVILIKLVDRLHNMRTLQYQSEEKQKKIASETLEVYAPIAHRLGISEIKNELEDLCFFYLHRDKYYEIANLVEVRKSERDEHVNQMISDISAMLTEHSIAFRIFGRSKHLYSIYKKMTTKNKRFDEILDLLAIRIITESELNCYEILGYIHWKYRPIPGRLKDYIAMPKMNMYQSLHTTIVGDGGNIFEVQIRTEEMDSIAERGVAAHWRYKEGSHYNPEKEQRAIEEKLSWFRDFSTLTEENDENAQQYMDVLRKDIFEANVYVMTPMGRVIDLPSGATPIDFAYRIHTDVGHSTIGAIVNGTLVPLNTELKTGDVVQIKTSKQSNGPSEDWLKFVKTAHARNKIKSFFLKKQQENRDEYISRGEAIFKEECKRRGLDDKEYMTVKKLETVLGAFNLNSIDDMMFAIAAKSLSMNAVMDKLIDRNASILENINRIFSKQDKPQKTRSKSGIQVAGVSTMQISMAGCCSPVKGDEIVGYITKGHGVKVHRKDCPNIKNEKNRLIDVEWEDQPEKTKYTASLKIYSNDRNFLLTDFVTVLSQLKSNLIFVNSEVQEDKIHVLTMMRIDVDDADHLKQIIANLRKVDSVISIERTIQ